MKFQTWLAKTEESDDDFDDDDDDGGEELDDEDGDMNADELFDLMDKLDEIEDEGDDTFQKLDPLYSVEKGKLIEDWVRSTAQEMQPVFVGLGKQLPADLQQIFQTILNGPVK
jgi:ribosomal protein L11 methylase PrmA